MREGGSEQRRLWMNEPVDEWPLHCLHTSALIEEATMWKFLFSSFFSSLFFLLYFFFDFR